MNEILNEIFEVCIIPLLAILTKYAVDYLKSIKANTNNDTANKYLDMLKETIADCVQATNQTYVDALKGKNAFDEDAQKVAFTMTYNAVMSVISEDSQEYLNSAVGDLQTYITQEIESTIKDSK